VTGKNVNFNTILKFLLKNTLDLNFKMDFQLPIFVHPNVLSPFRQKKIENEKMHFQKTYEKKSNSNPSKVYRKNKIKI
jgi:hypothetical protein